MWGALLFNWRAFNFAAACQQVGVCSLSCACPVGAVLRDGAYPVLVSWSEFGVVLHLWVHDVGTVLCVAQTQRMPKFMSCREPQLCGCGVGNERRRYHYLTAGDAAAFYLGGGAHRGDGGAQ